MIDRLEYMIAQQGELQRRLGYDFDKMTIDERIEFVKTMTLAATAELHEALNEVSWKPWATSKHFHTSRLLAELNDAWQFITNIWLAAAPEATPAELAQFMQTTLDEKLQVNHQRIENGYDGVTGKCFNCKRALDDPHVKCRAGVPSTRLEEAPYCEFPLSEHYNPA